ncbi:DUF6010 family protein [Rhizohabitans arisaemae]|uniref:DUF6010 family protein n=1 Tax=Rhizohabitans arisaemae TaxID=2720610 RepID=UPI0024B1B0C2|nr:DUF6010 family protein [Rhizohabitans arisaemae]
MRVTARAWPVAGQVLYVAAVAVATSYGIGAAARAGLLIPFAVPMGVAITAALSLLPDRVELAAWAGVTVVILAPTYLGHGGMEYAALAVVALLAVLGVFRTPWFLVAAWTLHPVWDLAVARHMAPVLIDLPVACVYYDLVVAGYLAYRTHRRRLVSFGRSRGEAAPHAGPGPASEGADPRLT